MTCGRIACAPPRRQRARSYQRRGEGKQHTALNKDQNPNTSQGLPSHFHRVLIRCPIPTQQAFSLVCAHGCPKRCQKSTDARARYPGYTASFTGTVAQSWLALRRCWRPLQRSRCSRTAAAAARWPWAWTVTAPHVTGKGKRLLGAGRSARPRQRSSAEAVPRPPAPVWVAAGPPAILSPPHCWRLLPEPRRVSAALGHQTRSQLGAPIAAYFVTGQRRNPPIQTWHRSVLKLLGETETWNST